MLIVPTSAEGFSWTPVHTMAGPGTSATYYSDVRVPVTNRVGEENGGWNWSPIKQPRTRRPGLRPAIFTALTQVREWAQHTKDARRSG